MAIELPNRVEVLGPSMAVRALPRVFLVAHGAQDPTDDEWAAFLHWTVELLNDPRPSIIYTRGGRPTALQRKQLAEVLQKRAAPRTAVLTDNTLVRTVVRLLSWANPLLRAFPPDDIEAALTYLEVPLSDTVEVRAELKVLRSRVGA